MTRNETIESNANLPVLVLGGFTACWMGATALIGIALLVRRDDGREMGPAWVMLALFAAVAVFLIMTTLRLFRATRAFGVSRLELDGPVCLGRPVSGVLRAPAALQRARDVELRVTCWSYSSDRDRRRDPEWQHVARLALAVSQPGADHVAIPFSVLLPADGRPSGDVRGPASVALGERVVLGAVGEIRWFLELRAAVPEAPDYLETFPLTVASAPSLAS
jgi:hypothetical protein